MSAFEIGLATLGAMMVLVYAGLWVPIALMLCSYVGVWMIKGSPLLRESFWRWRRRRRSPPISSASCRSSS